MASCLVLDQRRTGNEILATLPAAELGRLRPHLLPVELVANQVLYGAGAPIDYVYFLEEGLAALTTDIGDDSLVGVGLVGRDGVLGGQVLLSPHAISIYRTVVQIPGRALRMPVDAFRDAASELAALRDRCLQAVYVALVQASQIAGCNARHELSERLARWLLTVSARVDNDELPVTQDFLAHMLGVHRPGVSTVASGLQSRGLIRQGRGRITVLDRAGLEAEACNCYRLIEGARHRITGQQHLGLSRIEDCCASGLA
jgi:CRP-like cAMP-binding protein